MLEFVFRSPQPTPLLLVVPAQAGTTKVKVIGLGML